MKIQQISKTKQLLLLFPACHSQLSWMTNVVLEDISFSCGATKPQMLDLIQDKTLTTDSHHISDSNFLMNFCLKTPIAWGNSVDVWWTQVDIIVSEKLHMCATLADHKPSSLFSLFISFFFFFAVVFVLSYCWPVCDIKLNVIIYRVSFI